MNAEDKADIDPVNLGTIGAKSVSHGSLTRGEIQFGALLSHVPGVIVLFVMFFLKMFQRKNGKV